MPPVPQAPVVPSPPAAPVPLEVESAEGTPAPLAIPEQAFVARVAPPEPERPFPSVRRAIFFDVENTSRAQHIARVIDHLAVDRTGQRTDFVAIGNWRVIGHDTARLLAGHGAHLVHSAPSVGVRDWSDLRIAVGAGVWLAAARPGDSVEIVSDDRAFDVVGDVAANLGIAFRRLSYRALAGMPGEAIERAREPVHEPSPRAESSRGAGSSRRRRRGRRRGPRGAAPAVAVAPVVARPALPQAAGNGRTSAEEPHTAPHDEIVTVVRDLVHGAPARAVTIDTLANALKARGFRRPPGSPRLITRLRRIRELAIDRAGLITLVGAGVAEHRRDESAVGEDEGRARDEVGGQEEPPEAIVAVTESDVPEIGNERVPGESRGEPPASGAGRRSRRGGRRRRRRPAVSGGEQPM